jgi:hypothetical protein
LASETLPATRTVRGGRRAADPINFVQFARRSPPLH